MPPGVGGGGAGSDGAIGVGAGFGTRFLAFALLAGFAFFLGDAPRRFAFLDFFATFNLPNRINQNYATALAEATTSNWRTPCVNHSSM
jgi:hypothetical protein